MLNQISEDSINKYVKQLPELIEETEKKLEKAGRKKGVIYRSLNTMGGDPEFFIADKNGDLIISHRLLDGKTIENKNSYKLFADGLAVEVNFHPDGCRAWIIDRIQAAFKRLDELAKKEKGHITFTPIIDLSKKVMNSIPPAYMIWGCEPVYNIYNIDTVLPPAEVHPLRYAGGHIHFAISKDSPLRHNIYGKKGYDEKKVKSFIKLCDLLIGIPSVLISNATLEKTRRTLYGRPGEYRPQPHGIEYRTLSNHYYQHPVLVNLMLALARDAYNLMTDQLKDQTLVEFITDQFSDGEVSNAIYDCDKKAAWEIWKKVYPYVAVSYSNLSGYYTQWDKNKYVPSKFLALVLQQPDKFFNEYDNYERNWRFDIVSNHNTIGGWEDFQDPKHVISSKKTYDIISDIAQITVKPKAKAQGKAK